MDLTGYGFRKRNAREAAKPSGERADTLTMSADLSADTLRMLAKVLPHVPLSMLPSQYPRVLNQLAAVWPDAAATRRCFDGLLLDERGTRQGFPPGVVNELTALRHYYFTELFPEQLDPWQRGLLR